ncbi:MAG TPA: hypothetical protein VJ547_12035 [Candidatus Thermoplasmatota archaeon]|nr:hypothetical protein [Candidatus Thermoplasmatota archaeon]
MGTPLQDYVNALAAISVRFAGLKAKREAYACALADAAALVSAMAESAPPEAGERKAAMGMVSALLAAIAVECGLPENPREVGISPKHPPNDVAVEKFNEAINRALGGDAGAKQGG